MIRIIVADDHTLVRSGIRLLLGTLADIQIVGEAADGRELLEKVAELQPDLVLTDISMPSMNGVEATHRIRRDFPDTRVIILSMHASREFVQRALDAGAHGFLPKNASRAELEVAIRGVATGGRFFGTSIADHIVSRADDPEPDQPLLSHRQREILQLIAEGQTSRAIGDTLHLSTRTVETHRRRIMERLEIHDLAGLIRYAIRVGLVEP